MTRRERLRALLAGALAGVAAGTFGVGGGLVLIPLLTGVFGFTQHRAHGTSLAVIGFTALASIAVYGAFSKVEWLTALLVAITSVLTARYGARLAVRLTSRGLARTFAAFLIVVALRLLWKAPGTHQAGFHQGLPGLGFDLVLGSAIGVVSGLMGVGGGILAVPAFTLVLGMTQQLAQGTSLAIIAVTAPAGAIEHHRHGNVVLRWVPFLAIGAAVGGPLASWAIQEVPHALLSRVFALFLLYNAGATWLRAGRIGREAPGAAAAASERARTGGRPPVDP